MPNLVDIFYSRFILLCSTGDIEWDGSLWRDELARVKSHSYSEQVQLGVVFCAPLETQTAMFFHLSGCDCMAILGSTASARCQSVSVRARRSCHLLSSEPRIQPGSQWQSRWAGTNFFDGKAYPTRRTKLSSKIQSSLWINVKYELLLDWFVCILYVSLSCIAVKISKSKQPYFLCPIDVFFRCWYGT